MSKVFAIYDTQENEFVTFNSRCAWSKMGTAKNAFTQNSHVWIADVGFVKTKYDEQTRYEIVELSEVFYQMKQLEK